ncbi:MAG TPA: hypothetical protein VGW38_02370, partial [Chloroflexota bacterium]|nr:hypothetical protein [Chloroflexota bacterium]
MSPMRTALLVAALAALAFPAMVVGGQALTVGGAGTCVEPKLLLSPQGRPWMRTNNLSAAQIAHLDTLPFDGMVVHTAIEWTFNTHNFDPKHHKKGTVPVSYQDVMGDLAPIKGKFKNLTHNFLFVYLGKPPDVFDDWTDYIATFKNFAKAANDMDFEGIVFDQEQYMP